MVKRTVCVYPGCGRRGSKHPELVYFGFPTRDMERSLKWIDVCQRPDLLVHITTSDKLRLFKICQRHFHHSAFVNALHKKLIHSAVPSLDGHTHTDQTTMPQASAAQMECREPCLPPEETPGYIPVDMKPRDGSPNTTENVSPREQSRSTFEDCFDAVDTFFGCPIEELSVKRPGELEALTVAHTVCTEHDLASSRPWYLPLPRLRAVPVRETCWEHVSCGVSRVVELRRRLGEGIEGYNLGAARGDRLAAERSGVMRELREVVTMCCRKRGHI